MRKLVAAAMCGLFVWFAPPATDATAQPPDRLDSYRILPGRSVLRETGGFAGVDVQYRVEGTYDFAQEWGVGDPVNGLQPTARFVDADVRAPLGELLPAFIDVDFLLNLEGLDGEPLPLGAPFDVYRFRGLGNTSAAASPLEQSSVELYAALIGPWMFVYGETTPPPFGADYFEYELRMLARSGPWADMNDDGVVNIADYTAIVDAGASNTLRDGSSATLEDWAAQYGETLPDMAAMESMLSAALSSAVAVPEPASVCYFVATVVMIATSGSRQRIQ